MKMERDLAAWSAMSWLIGHYEGTHNEQPPPFVMEAYRQFGAKWMPLPDAPSQEASNE